MSGKDLIQESEGGYTSEGYPLCPQKGCGTFYKVRNGVFPKGFCPVCEQHAFFPIETCGNPGIKVLQDEVKKIEGKSPHGFIVSNAHQKKHSYDPDKGLMTITLEFKKGYPEISKRLEELHNQKLSVFFFNEEAIV